MNRAFHTLVVAAIAMSLSCELEAEAGSGQIDPATAYATRTVDSILPSGEALRRFQSDLRPVTVFRNGAASRDELVVRFIQALEGGDSGALRRLHLSKAEYAFLYFPTSPYSRKPYELPPQIAWVLSEQNSLKGLTRAQRRLGGKRLGFLAYECGAAMSEGANRFWRSCSITYEDPITKGTERRQLFGAIVERGGAYKFLSYANDF